MKLNPKTFRFKFSCLLIFFFCAVLKSGAVDIYSDPKIIWENTDVTFSVCANCYGSAHTYWKIFDANGRVVAQDQETMTINNITTKLPAGVYTVEVEIGSGPNTKSSTIFYVNGIQEKKEICPSQTKTFSTPVWPGATYTWTTSSNLEKISASGNTITVKPILPGGGNGIITLTVTRWSVPETKSFEITQWSVPVVPVITGPSQLCKNPGTQYYNSNWAGSDMTYTWSFSSPTIQYSLQSGAPSATITFGPQYNAEGTLKLTVANSCGSNTTTKNIYISEKVPAALSVPSGPTYISDPTQNSTYTIQPITGSSQWLLTPSTAGVVTSGPYGAAIVDWNNNFTGGATLQVRTSNGCGASPWSPSLYIGGPTPICTGSSEVKIYGPIAACTNGSDGYFTPSVLTGQSGVTWVISPSNAGTISPNGPYGNFTVNWNENYTGGQVKLTIIRNAENCASLPQIVSVSVGNCVPSGYERKEEGSELGSESLFDSSIKLYPNPSNNGFQLHTTESILYGSLEIIGQNGSIMYKSSFTNINSDEKYGEDLKPGVYAVRISYNGHSKVLKYIRK